MYREYYTSIFYFISHLIHTKCLVRAFCVNQMHPKLTRNWIILICNFYYKTTSPVFAKNFEQKLTKSCAHSQELKKF